MPGWGDILQEIQASADPATGAIEIDPIRRRYIKALHDLTGNAVVVYATDWMGTSSGNTQIVLQDMQGLMEVFRDLNNPNLDLILHSPGGQAEAADRLVGYMRSKFERVRVIIPLAAMSAATMWALSADEIVMGKHSQVGPIDPQITLPSGITVPAGALIAQFQEASDQCASDPARLTGWLPTLQQYPPGILNVCENASSLAVTLVAKWLEQYSFAGQPDAAAKAQRVAQWFGDDATHLSHGRAITREELRAQDLPITDLEDDSELQDAVLSVHHAFMHTFGVGSAVKVIENHLGRAFIQHDANALQMAQNPQQPGGGAAL
ncbi:hypothetical protein SEA_BEEGEE_31 [Gordonia phage BeeGee]|nr:hypothetical protein SEA_BEEGEE_31 [Gordonia phage BeeGee]